MEEEEGPQRQLQLATVPSLASACAMSTPRSHKRKIPVIMSDEDQEEVLVLGPPVPPAAVVPEVEPVASVETNEAAVVVDEAARILAEEEERARIWDMFAEEYHDSQYCMARERREY